MKAINTVKLSVCNKKNADDVSLPDGDEGEDCLSLQCDCSPVCKTNTPDHKRLIFQSFVLFAGNTAPLNRQLRS
jgi:hypothetical protein